LITIIILSTTWNLSAANLSLSVTLLEHLISLPMSKTQKHRQGYCTLHFDPKAAISANGGLAQIAKSKQHSLSELHIFLQIAFSVQGKPYTGVGINVNTHISMEKVLGETFFFSGRFNFHLLLW